MSSPSTSSTVDGEAGGLLGIDHEVDEVAEVLEDLVGVAAGLARRRCESPTT